MKITRIVYIFLIYVLAFVLCKEIIMTHVEWIPNRLFIPHNQYNHTTTANFIHTAVDPANPDEKRDIRINSQELREDNDIIIPKPENVYRILMVGDSFIFGGNVKPISDVVEAALICVSK